MILDASFYEQSTVEVARQLLGKLLVRQTAEGRASGLIVEVESYLHVDDPASHSHRGPGNKNRSMYLEPGSLYVYSIHAKYCMNVVTEPIGKGAAVLIRAVEPFEGKDWMARNRPGSAERDLTRGPARLCQALGIDRRLDGHDLKQGVGVWVEIPNWLQPDRLSVTESSRIGISSAQDLPLRLFVDGNRYVSGLAKYHSIPPRTSLVADG